MSENIFVGIKNRILQLVTRQLPGGSLRIWLHKLRGVKIGENVWIGYDVILETAHPEFIKIGNNVTISMRVTIIAHFKSAKSVIIDDDAFIGPGSIILPNVKIGKGAVVTAGSVVTTSIAPNMMVQGNPARPIARCSNPLDHDTPLDLFFKGLKPIKK